MICQSPFDSNRGANVRKGPLDAWARVQARAKPWTQDGFNTSWQKIKKRLEAEGKIGPGLTLYGLRHTVATILREMGYDERTIADAIGQEGIEMARHYAKRADLNPKIYLAVQVYDSGSSHRGQRKGLYQRSLRM